MFTVFALWLTLSLSVALVSVVYAAEVSPMAYQPGTSYTYSHSVNVNADKFTDAPEAHAYYWFHQDSEHLPVQVYY